MRIRLRQSWLYNHRYENSPFSISVLSLIASTLQGKDGRGGNLELLALPPPPHMLLIKRLGPILSKIKYVHCDV